ncbi:MAG TPA: hypothetical protein PK323_12865 [Bacteroidia bacterium]|nr:hypothetical protein [Bacteroidia bacterium]
MENIKFKMTLTQLQALNNVLYAHITIDIKALPMRHKMDIYILKEVFKKVRNRLENNSKNLTLKPVEALALFNYFGIDYKDMSYERLIINTCNTTIHQLFA